MGTVTNPLNTLQAARALAATLQKPSQPVALSPRYAALLAQIEAGTSSALLWKDARGRIQIIHECANLSPAEYEKARLNTCGGRRIFSHQRSLDDLGYGGSVWIISQNGSERFHCNLWSADQIDADAQWVFEPHLNCLYVREATSIEKKMWISGEAC